MRKRILIVCPSPAGFAPGQRLKYEQYFENWRENDYDITIKPFVSNSFQKIIYKKGYFFSKSYYTLLGYLNRISLLGRLKKYDIVYIFLWVTPFGLPLFETLYCRLAKKIIYDIDDLVYTTSMNAPWYSKLFKTKYKPIYLMKNAGHVITCTPYLDQFVRRFNNNTTDISSTVDTSQKYVCVNSYTNDDPLVIGWSGSHSTIQYFMILKNVLIAIQKKYPSIIIRVMGGSNIEIADLRVESTEWSDEKEIATLQSFDIGIYPLPDEQWVYGKSGLKAIQYMALGVPTIATAIGTNFRVIENEVSGYLVNNEEEWIEKLTMLIENPDLRKKIGMAGRLKVEKYFSVSANQQKYLNAFNTLLQN